MSFLSIYTLFFYVTITIADSLERQKKLIYMKRGGSEEELNIYEMSIVNHYIFILLHNLLSPNFQKNL